VTFDGTVAGLLVSLATAIGGPLIEYGLIHTLVGTGEGYHYTDSGEFGWGFPLWIIPGRCHLFVSLSELFFLSDIIHFLTCCAKLTKVVHQSN